MTIDLLLDARLRGYYISKAWSWFAHSRAALWLIALIFLTPRVALLALDVTPTSDAAWYMSRAELLARGHGYIDVTGLETAFWPPGWPMTMAALFCIFTASPLVVGAFNLLWSSITALLILRIAPRFFGPAPAGRMALLLLALYPNNALYVPLALTEIFFTGLVMLAIFIWVEGKRWPSYISAGLLFGFAILVKVQTILLLLMLALFALLHARAKKVHSYRQVLHQICLLVLAAALVVMPWTLRNHRVFGEWVLVSTNGGYSLLVANNPHAWQPYRGDDPVIQRFNADKRRVGELDYDRQAREQAMQWIMDHPLEFVSLAPLKFVRLWLPDGEGQWAYEMGMANWAEVKPYFWGVRIFNQFWYFGLLILSIVAGIVGLRSAWRAGQSPINWWMLPYLMALHATVTCLIFSGQTRYHFPVMPWFCLAAGWWIAQATEQRLARQRQAIERAG